MMPMFWFTGVVEDREDPLEMGRIRVRIFGLHTDDTTKIATADLPWSNVMMPCNSASISGLGMSPTGLLEGSWVVGFFVDGENAQDPIIIGSLPGKSTQQSNELKAFKDPVGKYPLWFDETDVSRLARASTWKTTPAYSTRYTTRLTGVETATPPKLDTTQLDKSASEYERKTWDEPEPRDGMSGLYPYVHTYESELGIIKEYDDTPNGARIHEYHPSGSFYEIYPDGKRSFKVTGDNYEVIIGSENILVRGSRNVTIEGNAKHLVKGDYTMEVTGNYNLKVHGERNTKITKNDNTEIVGNSNTNVKDDMILRVGKNQTLLVDVNKTETIGGTSNLAVTSSVDYTFLDTLTIFSNGNQAISTNASQRLLSKSGLEFGSQADWNLTCNANITINANGNFNIETAGNFVAHSAGSSAFTSDSTSTMNSSGTFGITASRIDLN